MQIDGRVYTDTTRLARLRHDARGFSFLPQQPIHSLLSGRKRSRLRGRGLDFEELRHYRPGDDIRDMDWRVTNRTGKPHVRVYTEERDRPVLLLVDQRLSMFFGSRERMKSVAAAEIAALAAWRVLEQGDRVGAIIFNDNQLHQFRPARGSAALMGLLGQLSKLNQSLHIGEDQQGNSAQFASALAIAERMLSHDSLLIIISDFDGWNANALASVRRLAQHNDLIAGLVYDPLEQDIAPATNLVVSDGRYQIQVQPEKAALGQRFGEQFASALARLQAELRKHGMPVIPVNTVDNAGGQLRRHLGQR